MRLSLLAFALAPLAACATSPSPPDTGTGQLAAASDVSYQCDDSAHSSAFSCGVKLAFEGDQLTASGLYKDGTAGGPGATGTLTANAAADLDALIAQLPMSTPTTITEEDCGGAPLRSTTFAIQYDDGQLKNFTYQYGSGVAQQIDDYVLELVRQVNACAGDRVTFASCTPNTAPAL